MKTAMLASALVAGMLLGTATGSPLRNKRTLVEEVVYVTASVEHDVVYVNEDGSPFLTVKEGSFPSVSVPAAAHSATSTSAEHDVVHVNENGSPFVTPNGGNFPASTAVQSPTSRSVHQVFTRPTPHVSPMKTSAVTAAPVSTCTSTSTIDTAPIKGGNFQLGGFTEQPFSKVPSSSVAESTTAQQPTSTEQPTSTQLAQASNTPSKTTSEVAQQSVSKNRSNLGITYDPFTGTDTNTRCKTEQEIANDFGNMTDYSIVRIYGMGCNIIQYAMQNVVKNSQKLMAGAYYTGGSDGENMTLVIQTLSDAVHQYANGDWSVVSLFAVENEQVNNHVLTAAAVVNVINSARSQLKGLGFTGLVGAVETVPAMISNPAICQSSDVTMVNCHAFFDKNTYAQDAATFVKSQVQQVQNACNNQRVIVTESGWPHQGDANGNAVPSPQNQQAAMDSLRNNFDHDLFLFSSYDSTWKSDGPSTFNAERYWGIMQ